MLLADYLTSEEITIPDFADLVGRSPEGVRLWVKGQRMPGTVDIVKIHQITNGQVCANDPYDDHGDVVRSPAQVGQID